jgi:hypothetical protein
MPCCVSSLLIIPVLGFPVGECCISLHLFTNNTCQNVSDCLPFHALCPLSTGGAILATSLIKLITGLLGCKSVLLFQACYCAHLYFSSL